MSMGGKFGADILPTPSDDRLPCRSYDENLRLQNGTSDDEKSDSE